jgi:hypothetical protein
MLSLLSLAVPRDTGFRASRNNNRTIREPINYRYTELKCCVPRDNQGQRKRRPTVPAERWCAASLAFWRSNFDAGLSESARPSAERLRPLARGEFLSRLGELLWWEVGNGGIAKGETPEGSALRLGFDPVLVVARLG